MTLWVDYPSNWAKPGHIPRGYENEAILDRLASLNPEIIAIKTADETIISTGTYQDDDHLFLEVEASGVYVYKIRGGFVSSTTADFRHRMSAPSGTFSGTYFDYSTAAGTNSRLTYSNPTDAANTGLDGKSPTETSFEFGGIFTCGSTGGTLQWQWAQDVSTASNTIVRAGATITAIRTA